MVLQHPLHGHHEQIPQGESAVVSSLRTFLAGQKTGASWEPVECRGEGEGEAGEGEGSRGDAYRPQYRWLHL